MMREEVNFDWELRQIEKALLKHHSPAENIMSIFSDIENRAIDKQEINKILSRPLAINNSQESLNRCNIIKNIGTALKRN